MSAPSRRILSVWLRRLPTDRIERRCGLPGDAPLIVVEPVKSALRVCALNDAAARLGLHCGLPLADVRAMHPGIDRQIVAAIGRVAADPQHHRVAFGWRAGYRHRAGSVAGILRIG